MKKMFNKNYFAPVLGILNKYFVQTSVQKSSRIKAHNALVLPFFYMDAKLGPLKKRIKTIDINRDEISEEQPGSTFWTTKGVKKLWNS